MKGPWLILLFFHVVRTTQTNRMTSIYKISRPFQFRIGFVQWKIKLDLSAKLAHLDGYIQLMEIFLNNKDKLILNSFSDQMSMNF